MRHQPVVLSPQDVFTVAAWATVTNSVINVHDGKQRYVCSTEWRTPLGYVIERMTRSSCFWPATPRVTVAVLAGHDEHARHGNKTCQVCKWLLA